LDTNQVRDMIAKMSAGRKFHLEFQHSPVGKRTFDLAGFRTTGRAFSICETPAKH
jgi:hypothetical protein